MLGEARVITPETNSPSHSKRCLVVVDRGSASCDLKSRSQKALSGAFCASGEPKLQMHRAFERPMGDLGKGFGVGGAQPLPPWSDASFISANPTTSPFGNANW